MDFFTVPTVNFAILYVFLVFDHGRRKVIHFAITRNPSMQWVIQQLREAMPFGLHPNISFAIMMGSTVTEYGHFWTVVA